VGDPNEHGQRDVVPVLDPLNGSRVDTDPLGKMLLRPALRDAQLVDA
jgi:hypothetical protein